MDEGPHWYLNSSVKGQSGNNHCFFSLETTIHLSNSLVFSRIFLFSLFTEFLSSHILTSALSVLMVKYLWLNRYFHFPCPQKLCGLNLTLAYPCFRNFLLIYHLSGSPHKEWLYFIDLNAKVGNQEISGVTGKFGLGVQNEARQRLVEFCQQNTLVIADTLF